MTLEEWQRSADALAMLQCLFPMRGPDSAVPMTRRCRFYLVALAVRYEPWLPWGCRTLVKVAQEDHEVWPARVGVAASLHTVALELPTYDALPEDWDELDHRVARAVGLPADTRPRRPIPQDLWVQLTRLISFMYHTEVPPFAQLKASTHNADMVRELFTGLAVRVPFEKSWRTETVSCIAEQIYAESAFDTMPVLADALEEAGCNQPLLMNHMRETNAKHCRGCWALDLARGEG
jgi:hypothetical protein